MAKLKSFIPVGVAIIIALITSLMIYSYLQKKSNAREVVIEIQPVAVAAVDLSWGTTLTKDMIKKVDFLKRSLPEDSIADPASLAGRVLVYPVKANEPIFESRLAPTNVKTGGVGAVISQKKRAVAVKVDKVIGVSGFIQPGSRVDVLITLSTGKAHTPITKTILENLLVLASGSDTKDKKGFEERASTTDVITLEVTPEEAEKLAMATAEWKIQLALRNFNDTANVLTSGTTLPALLASYSLEGPVREAGVVTKKSTENKSPAPEPPSSSVVKGVSQAGGKPPVLQPLPDPPVREASQESSKKSFTVELIKGSKLDKVNVEGSE
jgi:pilus assembly protein CpaB